MNNFWDFLETLVIMIALMTPFLLMGFVVYMACR